MTPRRRAAAAWIRARRPRGERGMFTIAVLFWTIFTVVLGGFVVDAGQAITYRQQAGDIAEQAARYGADDLDQNALRAGLYVLNPNYCAEAKQLVADAEPPGTTASCTQGNTTVGAVTVPVVTVTVTVTYKPVLLSALWTGTFVANSTQSAHPVPGP